MTTDSSSAAVPADQAAADPAAADQAAAGPLVIRYRCAACGNLTRFDVVTSRRTRAFHHYSVGGELAVEDVEVLNETVEQVTCRWCGNGNSVEVLEDGAGQAG